MARLRVWGLVLFLAVTVVGRANAAGEMPSTGADHAQALIGTWSCTTIHDSATHMTIAQSAPGVLELSNKFTASNGSTGSYDEHYRYDAKTGRWFWTSTFPGDSSEKGTAGTWSGTDWVFDGTTTVTTLPTSNSVGPAHTSTQPVRMVYTYIDANTFHRQFEVQNGDQWVTRNASSCHRAPST